MFKHSATNANKSPEPPLTHPGAPPDSERAKQPPLPEPPYWPYIKKPAEPEHPSAPYKGLQFAGEGAAHHREIRLKIGQNCTV